MADSTNHSDNNIDIIEFIQLLNNSVRNKKVSDISLSNNNKSTGPPGDNTTYTLRLCSLLLKIEELFVNHDPREYKNCRFGNTAFSTWLNQVTEMCDTLFIESKIEIPVEFLETAKKHFLNSFGNKTRIDFGTGHELEFVYFLKDLYTLKLIPQNELESIVLVLLNRYFEFVRRLLDRYTLEPAGSKGAWGIDDYQFLPFIFGSSQLISSGIDPSECLKLDFVSAHRDEYLFMRAMEYKIQMIKGVSIEIGSPMICNILTSCVWEKINSGLFQLYINDVQRLTAKKVVNR